MSNFEPRFEDILKAADAAVQRGLAKVTDDIVAAALVDARKKIAAKILSNLSERRRAEISLRQEKFPPRTREVARNVVWKAVFGIEDEEDPDPGKGGKSELLKFMEKMSETHPDFIRAREEGRGNLFGVFFRRLLGK